MEKEVNKGVTSVVSEVCEEICNNYCKYSDNNYKNEANNNDTCGHYEDCPLNRMMVLADIMTIAH